MEQTPKANRIHIGFFGRCNAGKSTVINLLTGQNIALVSEVAGTTTDPVSKSMEILPLGPVMLVDTAGIDDTSELGALRVQRTAALLPGMHIAVYLLRSDQPPTEEDLTWLRNLKSHKIPVLVVINCQAGDTTMTADAYLQQHDVCSEFSFPYIGITATEASEQTKLLKKLGELKGAESEEVSLLDGVITAGDTVVLVCPIDSAAPKGRLILPQVQMLREILDKRAQAVVVQTEELPAALAALKTPPKLVITDSQAFEAVAEMVPLSIPMTSFSILMARFKGELKPLVAGVKALQNLKKGSRILISEGCTHHRQCDDIGTVKIPRWLAKAGYDDVALSWTSGGMFPESLADYDLVIHCGACMLTRREVLRRLEASLSQGVPIVNYGVLIAFLHGILERALTPFAEELS